MRLESEAGKWVAGSHQNFSDTRGISSDAIVAPLFNLGLREQKVFI